MYGTEIGGLNPSSANISLCIEWDSNRSGKSVSQKRGGALRLVGRVWIYDILTKLWHNSSIINILRTLRQQDYPKDQVGEIREMSDQMYWPDKQEDPGKLAVWMFQANHKHALGAESWPPGLLMVPGQLGPPLASTYFNTEQSYHLDWQQHRDKGICLNTLPAVCSCLFHCFGLSYTHYLCVKYFP